MRGLYTWVGGARDQGTGEGGGGRGRGIAMVTRGNWVGSLHDLRTTPPLAHLLLGESGINHKDDAVNGQGGLRNVGGDDDLAPDGSVWSLGGRGLKDALLEVWREGGVEGDALELAHFVAEVLHLSLDALASLLNFLCRTYDTGVYIPCTCTWCQYIQCIYIQCNSITSI